MNRLKVNESPKTTKQLWSLANGPKPHVKEYTVCMVNGVKFHTRDLDNRRVTQNSGVCTEGNHEGEMHDFMIMCAKFGNWNMCFTIKLFCSSVNGTILVPMVEGKR